MLDDINLINQRDSAGALSVVRELAKQAEFEPRIDGRLSLSPVAGVVIAGVGEPALAGDIAKILLKDRLSVPLEIVRGYDLPRYVNHSTLVVVISHSGDDEEVLACFDQMTGVNCPLVVVCSGGRLADRAKSEDFPRLMVPASIPSHLSTICHLKSILRVLEQHGLIDSQIRDEISSSSDWLASKTDEWMPEVPTQHNYAKQLALMTVGKTAIFYGGQITAPLAYKWKTSWNEVARNIAFSNQYPELSHNEFIGWTSHPVEKPFAVFDIQSSFERPRILERMELSDRILSGMRPHATTITCLGDGLVRQVLWAISLADATSIYGAILNNISPSPSDWADRLSSALN